MVLFSASSVPMATSPKMEYLMLSLSNNCTATGETLFISWVIAETLQAEQVRKDLEIPYGQIFFSCLL
jgi:hypothetical protein